MERGKDCSINSWIWLYGKVQVFDAVLLNALISDNNAVFSNNLKPNAIPSSQTYFKSFSRASSRSLFLHQHRLGCVANATLCLTLSSHTHIYIYTVNMRYIVIAHFAGAVNKSLLSSLSDAEQCCSQHILYTMRRSSDK